ncbi:OmpA family protein [Sphingomonas solaris]|uniref:OmpA family protein n=1 Tax=Alterirhizorhabdus solaris TaxID=2529389 RepID=A0A558RBX0_9SPHN|nr:OmpA family protein [Sphingomonas solaris]TVV76851.1 OmpA family protein [Sphingomonas solaris]
MWRVIGCWAAVAALVLGTPGMARGASPAAAVPAAGEIDSPDAIVCQLLSGCPSSEAVAPPTARGGRVTNTRGFSFQEKPAEPPPAPATGRYDLRIGFVFASAELTPADRMRAGAFAAALRDPRIVDRRIRIEGHTDSVGGDSANLDLSRRRARAVGEALVAAGIDGSRLDLEGYGARRPLPDMPADSGANRRVIATLAM